MFRESKWPEGAYRTNPNGNSVPYSLRESSLLRLRFSLFR
jgi:hypothetical protein